MNFDVKCPHCGRINRQCDLDETDGWMECDCCNRTMHFGKTIEGQWDLQTAEDELLERSA